MDPKIIFNPRVLAGKRTRLPRGTFIKVDLLHSRWCTALANTCEGCTCNPSGYIVTEKTAIVVFPSGRAVGDWRSGKIVEAEVITK